MERHDVEALFRRFREESDTDALAQVFERVAPGLLRTATALCGCPVTGEDLLQATCVTAIERRDRWDAERPLVPWLVGILTRHAREARRRGARAIDATRLEPRRAVGPDEAGEARELRAALDAGLDDLPEPLRQVAVLSLRHELAPAEIAEALGRSPSTVRTQLQRALARLRVRLPRSLAPLGAWLALHGVGEARGLAAVRGEVLRHARRALPPPVPAASLPFGPPGVAMLKTLACALVALGFVTLRPLPAQEAGEPALPVAASPVTPVPSAVRSADDMSATGRSAVAAATTSAPAVGEQPGPPSQERATIVALVVEVRDPVGAAVEGARVALDGVRLFEEPGSLYGWRAGVVAPSTTDRAGRAELVLPAVWNDKHPDAIHFTVAHPSFAPFRSSLVELADGSAEALLEWGARLAVAGWVAGTDGERVHVLDVSPELGERSEVARGDWYRRDDGRLETSGLAPGAHNLSLAWTDAGGRRFASAIEALVLEPGGSHAAELELLPVARVTGRLGDEVPRPVTGGEVVAHQSGGKERMLARTWRAPVAADGTFEFEAVAPGVVEVGVLVDGWTSVRAEGVEGAANPSAAVAGADVELPVPMVRTGVVDVTAVDPGSAPVPGVRLSAIVPVRWGDGRWQYFEAIPSVETDAAGRGLLENVPPGVPRLTALHRELRIDGPFPLTSETALAGDPLEPGETRVVRLELVRRSEP